ncbi:MAG: hypothetical protein PHE50_08450 [Dehalococcoidales bacterium]|nr:hypothetical protein [Dehalococcoidales bacterium]
MERKKTQFAVALDMHGCPNRCKHCWIGHSKNPNVSIKDFIWLVQQFRDYESKGNKYFDGIEFASWYREPDFPDNYKEMWELEKQLSDRKRRILKTSAFGG